MSKVFTATIEVPAKTICNELVGAFEGGSNYWIESVDLISPPYNTIPNPEDVIFWGRDALYTMPFDILVIEEEEHKEGAGREHHLTPEKIQQGLTVMATKYGRHFGDMMSENSDAVTADVFLQCCLFGEVIYG